MLLNTALRHTVNEANIEAGFERFRSIAGASIDLQAFCGAVDACLREGLIREPIRLPEGALQCHWHLELTSKGVEAAHQLLERLSPPPNPLPQGEAESVRSSPSPCGRGLGGGDKLQRTSPS
jgi:hypothetical protein